MTIVLPHTFHDGVKEVASGKQVMENLQVLADALDALAASQLAPAAVYTAGPAWALDTEYEPDAAHPTFVTVRWGLYPAGGERKQTGMIFYVAGVEAARNALETQEGATGQLEAETASFIVPAKAKWKAHKSSGAAAPEQKLSRYLQL